MGNLGKQIFLSVCYMCTMYISTCQLATFCSRDMYVPGSAHLETLLRLAARRIMIGTSVLIMNRASMYILARAKPADNATQYLLISYIYGTRSVLTHYFSSGARGRCYTVRYVYRLFHFNSQETGRSLLLLVYFCTKQ